MVPLIGNPFLYLIAIAAGVCVSTALVVILKGMRKSAPEGGADGAGDATAQGQEPKIPVAV